MNKKIVIISGGELEEEFVLSILEKEENQYVIGVDKGMEFLYSHQILPNYIVGDFDSVCSPSNCPSRKLIPPSALSRLVCAA